MKFIKYTGLSLVIVALLFGGTIDMASAQTRTNTQAIDAQTGESVDLSKYKIRLGSKNENVLNLNSFLGEKGYRTTSSDRYGLRTWLSVRKYQKESRVKPTATFSVPVNLQERPGTSVVPTIVESNNTFGIKCFNDTSELLRFLSVYTGSSEGVPGFCGDNTSTVPAISAGTNIDCFVNTTELLEFLTTYTGDSEGVPGFCGDNTSTVPAISAGTNIDCFVNTTELLEFLTTYTGDSEGVPGMCDTDIVTTIANSCTQPNIVKLDIDPNYPDGVEVLSEISIENNNTDFDCGIKFDSTMLAITETSDWEIDYQNPLLIAYPPSDNYDPLFKTNPDIKIAENYQYNRFDLDGLYLAAGEKVLVRFMVDDIEDGDIEEDGNGEPLFIVAGPSSINYHFIGNENVILGFEGVDFESFWNTKYINSL
jgi:hypothetical protein